MQISVRFLKFIRLHRYRLKFCLMLIVCAMFRTRESRAPLRRPLGLSSPTVPLFSRADWGGRSASAPSAAFPALVLECLRRSRHRPVPRFNFRCAGTGGPAAPQSSSGQWLIARRLHRGPNASARTSASACLSADREIPQTCWGSRPAAFGSFVISQARDEVPIPAGSHRQADSNYGRRTAAQPCTAWLRGDRNTHRSN